MNLSLKFGRYCQHPFGMLIKERAYTSDSYRFGFNGKEKIDEVSGEGNTYDLGARMFSPRHCKMFSPDPREKDYPWQSTFAYFSNSPIVQLDFNGEGDYYGKDGKHLGSDNLTKTVGEGTNSKQVGDDKAYTSSEAIIKKFTSKEGIVDWGAVQGDKGTTDLTTKYGLSNTNLLNRANWAYGEGGGEYLDHYAHTMNNLRKHGPSGRKPYSSDEEMFKTKMKHQINVKQPDGTKKKKIINLYPGYFNGTAGGPQAKQFANARGNLTTLTNDLTMRAAIGSVIGSVMGTTTDPTGGAYQWVGGSGSGGGIFKSPDLNNAKNVTNVTSGEGKAMRYHTFYQLIKE